MCIVVSIKVGYKVTLLDKILSIFDIGRGYLRGYAESKKQERRCKDIDFGWKPHFIYSMIVLKPIWEGDDGKYSRADGIKRCWRKAVILLVCWECDINNDVGGSYIPISKKALNKDYGDNI